MNPRTPDQLSIAEQSRFRTATSTHRDLIDFIDEAIVHILSGQAHYDQSYRTTIDLTKWRGYVEKITELWEDFSGKVESILDSSIEEGRKNMIIELVKYRCAAGISIGSIKSEFGIQALDPKRKEEIQTNHRNHAKKYHIEDQYDSLIAPLFSSLHDLNVDLEKKDTQE